MGVGKGNHKNHARGPTHTRWTGGSKFWLIRQPEYRSWHNMKSRCLDPSNHKWPSYGGRGITVCRAWLDFTNFLRDMGERPSSEHTLERKNSNRKYNRRKCYWGTPLQQNRNLTN